MTGLDRIAAGFGELRDDELVLELIGLEPHAVHKVPTYFFRMVHAESKEELGGINLRTETTSHIEFYAGHVGFGVHAAHRGHRYAARAVKLLLPVAVRLGLDPLWITCDPDNVASRRSCELAGAQFVEIVEVPANCIIHRSGHKQKCRYRIEVRDAG